MTEPANVEYEVIRQDKFEEVLYFFEMIDGVKTPIDVAARFQDLILEVRTEQDPDSRLLIKRTLSDSGITISATDVNKVTFDLTNNIKRGRYYYDFKVREAGSDDWETYYRGSFIVTGNVSDTWT